MKNRTLAVISRIACLTAVFLYWFFYDGVPYMEGGRAMDYLVVLFGFSIAVLLSALFAELSLVCEQKIAGRAGLWCVRCICLVLFFVSGLLAFNIFRKYADEFSALHNPMLDMLMYPVYGFASLFLLVLGGLVFHRIYAASQKVLQ